jgi:uncharacterized protein YjiS (DUF1127 family)
MAYAAHTQTATFGFGFIRAGFAALAEKLEKRRVYRTTYNELAALSSRELNDLGICRTMIASIAYETAYKN